MPVARFQMPDGRIARFEVPEGTTPEQAQTMMAQHFDQKQPEAQKKDSSFLGDLAAGAVRGAGSIGATILAPIDAAARAMGVQNDFIGRTDRRQAMTEALGTMGADTDSLAFGAGKLGAEIAGTAGAGGVLGRGVAAIAPKAAPLAEALTTGGLKAGGMTGAKGMALRTVAGGATGGAMAGMVNPGEADTGAMIGAALPGVVKAAGAAGGAIGRTIRGPQAPEGIVDAAKAAQSAGYVIPPTQVNASLRNRLLEGTAGKLTMAQNASAKGQTVTNRLAAKALGLADDTKITPDLLSDIRKTAGQSYDDIGKTGVIRPGEKYDEALDKIVIPHLQAAVGFPAAKPSPVVGLIDSLRSNAFDASSAVAKVKELRSAADDAFRTGNTDIGRASKAAAKAIEDVLEKHLADLGDTNALAQLKDARTLIAKTYSVEKALNPTTGNIDAGKLGALIKRGKPLSGELRTAGEFANAFPKAAQPIEGMGSLPQFSPLDMYAGAGTAGVMGALTGNPMSAIALGLPLARIGARNLALSPMVQRGLTVPRSTAPNMLANSELQQFLTRAAPIYGVRE